MDPQAKAAHAQRLMDDPLLMEAFANVRQAATQAWEATKADDQKSREVAWLTVKVIARIESELEAIIADGKIAASRVQAPLR